MSRKKLTKTDKASARKAVRDAKKSDVPCGIGDCQNVIPAKEKDGAFCHGCLHYVCEDHTGNTPTGRHEPDEHDAEGEGVDW